MSERVLKWQPIATAPKDGTPILLFLKRPIDSDSIIGWVPQKTKFRVVVGWTDGSFYRDGSVEWRCGFCDEGTADTEGYSSPLLMTCYPSHWMPLPEPPK